MGLIKRNECKKKKEKDSDQEISTTVIIVHKVAQNKHFLGLKKMSVFPIV